MKPSAGAFFIFYLGISACLGFGVPNFPLFLSAINKRKLSNSSKSFFASSDKISPTEEKKFNPHWKSKGSGGVELRPEQPEFTRRRFLPLSNLSSPTLQGRALEGIHKLQPR
mmetsp:Transcript_14351/g.21271  ORF Transcript_14351/g.21271 Transcript_14351/m.21271 type:complete len:112 (-) Transcript_14351:1862-2197(-)